MLRTALLAAALFASSPAIAQSDPVGARVEVSGMRMYYETSGEGDPLIVLHSAYMNIRTMGEIIPVLARSRQVIAVEMQGHGRTTDIDRPITYPKLADDVAAFMDAIGVEKADVFGYSMGAAVGLQMAIRHPEKVDRAALASIAYDFHLLTRDYFATFTPKAIADAHATSEVLLALSRDSRAEVDAIVGAAAATGGKADMRERLDLGWMYNRAFEDPDGHVFEAVWVDMSAASAHK